MFLTPGSRASRNRLAAPYMTFGWPYHQLSVGLPVPSAGQLASGDLSVFQTSLTTKGIFFSGNAVNGPAAAGQGVNIYLGSAGTARNQLFISNALDMASTTKNGFRFFVGDDLPTLGAVNNSNSADRSFCLGDSGGSNVGFGFNFPIRVQADVDHTITIESSPAGNFGWRADSGLWLDATGVIAQRNGTNAQSLRVYNTFTDASNYERGVFDWGTTANALTIGTQKAGTGSARDVYVVADNRVKLLPGGGTAFWVQAGALSPTVVCDIGIGGTTSGGTVLLSFIQAGGTLDGVHTSKQFGFMSGINVNPDVALSRAAAKVAAFSDGASALGTANGWMQWAGQARVTSNVSVSNSAVLANVTGLSVSVAAGRTYSFEAILIVSSMATAGGVQAAIAGTATATNIIYDGWCTDTGATGLHGYAQSAALGGAVSSFAGFTGTVTTIHINGTITVNAAGTLTVQFAQNTSNATASVVARGSYFIVQDMP